MRADSKSRKTDLRRKSTSRSRDAGARVSNNGERCSEEWVRFGAWNVRSLRGREEELLEEMEKYKLEILGVSETKMKGNGSKAGRQRKMHFHVGIEEGRAKAGVAIFMSEWVSQCLREWKCVSKRIVKIRLRIEGV